MNIPLTISGLAFLLATFLLPFCVPLSAIDHMLVNVGGFTVAALLLAGAVFISE